MAKYRGPVCKLCRREGEKLFLKGERCFTPKCSFDRKNYAPGQHGQSRRSRISGTCSGQPWHAHPIIEQSRSHDDVAGRRLVYRDGPFRDTWRANRPGSPGRVNNGASIHFGGSVMASFAETGRARGSSLAGVVSLVLCALGLPACGDTIVVLADLGGESGDLATDCQPGATRDCDCGDGR